MRAAARAIAAHARPLGRPSRVTTYAAPRTTTAIASAACAETAANGRPPMTRAQAARYAANQPLTQASKAASGGATGATIAVMSAIPSRGATTGAASAFAGIEYSGTTPNCVSRMGAVASPHAPETATTSASERGTGYPANVC